MWGNTKAFLQSAYRIMGNNEKLRFTHYTYPTLPSISFQVPQTTLQVGFGSTLSK